MPTATLRSLLPGPNHLRSRRESDAASAATQAAFTRRGVGGPRPTAPAARAEALRPPLPYALWLLARLHQSAAPLVSAQSAAFEPVVAGLEQLAATATPEEFEATLAGWRLESARAVMRFLQGLAAHARGSAR